jgi:hypothetical protein
MTKIEKKLLDELIGLYEKWLDMKDRDILLYEQSDPNRKNPDDLYKGEGAVISRIDKIEAELLGEEL